MSDKKDITKYPAKYLSIFSENEDDILTLAAIPMQITKFAEVITITFKIWTSADDFENSKPTFTKWNIPTMQVSKENQPVELFTEINQSIFDYLKVSGSDHSVESFSINLDSLSFDATARDKPRNKKGIFDGTVNFEEFTELQTKHHELIENLFGFAWAFGQANNSKLSKFK